MKHTTSNTHSLFTKLLLGLMLVFMASLIAACGEVTETTTEEEPGNTETEATNTPADETADETATEEPAEEVVEAEEPEEPAEPEVSTEFQSALKQAQSYSDTMHMSKAGVFDQLTSEYGGQFPEDAAQYAIDNVDADWNANALESAKSYQETMSMSKEAIRDQLTSEYGGQFTAEEAEYAVSNLE